MSIAIHPDFARAVTEHWLEANDQVAISNERLSHLKQELADERARVANLDQLLQARDRANPKIIECGNCHQAIEIGRPPGELGYAPDVHERINQLPDTTATLTGNRTSDGVDMDTIRAANNRMDAEREPPPCTCNYGSTAPGIVEPPGHDPDCPHHGGRP